MSRWILGLLLAGTSVLAAQEQKTPQLEQRTPPKTSGKQAVPAEEDTSFLTEAHSFNPLESKNSVEVGDQYLKKGKVMAARNRYLDATMWNDGNGEAWKKLGQADVKLKDLKAAKEAYSKYLEVAPDAKDAAAVRKKLQNIK